MGARSTAARRWCSTATPRSPTPEWINNTLCLDTGCVFGGRLTALRYPERELVSVPAAEVYYEPAKPFPANADAARRAPTPQAVASRTVLDITDVTGKRVIETRYQKRIGGAGGERGRSTGGDEPVRDRPAVAALPAADDEPGRDLDPAGSARTSGAGLRRRSAADGVDQVVCEEKHMGSRAVALVCRTPEAAAGRFGAPGGDSGAVWTRTGRPFFPDDLTARSSTGCAPPPRRPGCSTSWTPPGCCSTAELLPWSAKADQLLRDQYAAVGAAARRVPAGAVAVLEQAAAARPGRRRPAGAHPRPGRERRRVHRCLPALLLADRRADRRADRAVPGARDRRAPSHHERPHAWHLDLADRLVAADAEPASRPTRRIFVDTTDATRSRPATGWWIELTGGGRRRHGRQARREPHPRAQGARPAGPEGPRTGVPADHLRPRLHRAGQSGTTARRATSATSGHSRCASTRSASRRWIASRATNRCGGCTSACSPSSRWNPNRSIHGSDAGCR